jgi:hypothetical protein
VAQGLEKIMATPGAGKNSETGVQMGETAGWLVLR